jgi:hypothetical protein
MALRRTALTVALLAVLVAGACGDSAEQKELKAYSDWLDEMDAKQTAILQPIDLNRGTLMTFANGLAPLIESRNVAQILKDARAARPTLAAIRDRVKPEFDAFAKEVNARSITASSIAEVHARLVRSAELRARGLEALAGVADRVDEILAVESIENDPELKAKLEKLQPPIQKGVQDAAVAIFGSEEALHGEWSRTKAALSRSGSGGLATLKAADRALGAQLKVIRDLDARLREVKGIDGLAPVLLAVERTLLPKYAAAVESAGKIEMPEGEASVAWGRIRDILRARHEALKGLADLTETVDRYCRLMAGMPETEIVEKAVGVLGVLPRSAEDLLQAAEGYRRFTEAVRALRGRIL